MRGAIASILLLSLAGASFAADAMPGDNERFYSVQKKLDEGGSFYFYADAKDGLKDFVAKMQAMLPGLQLPPQALMPISLGLAEIEHAGFYGVQDIGMSSTPEGELYRNKCFISFPEGRKGLFALLGGPAHPITALDYAPADTLLFSAYEADLAGLLPFMREVIANVGGPGAVQQFNQQLAASGMQSGINIEAIANSLSGPSCLVATMDPAQKLTFPSAGPGAQQVQIDEPRAVFVIDTKDATLYETLKTQLTQQSAAGAETAEGEMKQFSLIVPANPYWAVTPVIAADAGHCYIATHAEYLKKILAAKQSGGGLAQTEDYKKLSAGAPTEGNCLSYINAKVMDAYINAVTQTMGSMPAEDQSIQRLIEIIMPQSGGQFQISCNQPDGIFFFSRSYFDGRTALLSMGAAPMAILAAIAVPNFLEAQTRAKVSRVKADMRSMSVALEAYYIDSNVYPATDNLKGLTTPVSFITSFFPDAFGDESQTFQYYSVPSGAGSKPGWILWSPGPDQTLDILPNMLQQYFDANGAMSSPALTDKTYDPTNGTISSGDIKRTSVY